MTVPRISPAVLAKEDAAAYLSLNLRTFLRVAAAGEIPTVQLTPGRIGFRVQDLDAYIEAHMKPVGEPNPAA